MSSAESDLAPAAHASLRPRGTRALIVAAIAIPAALVVGPALWALAVAGIFGYGAVAGPIVGLLIGAVALVIGIVRRLAGGAGEVVVMPRLFLVAVGTPAAIAIIMGAIGMLGR